MPAGSTRRNLLTRTPLLVAASVLAVENKTAALAAAFPRPYPTDSATIDRVTVDCRPFSGLPISPRTVRAVGNEYEDRVAIDYSLIFDHFTCAIARDDAAPARLKQSSFDLVLPRLPDRFSKVSFSADVRSFAIGTPQSSCSISLCLYSVVEVINFDDLSLENTNRVTTRQGKLPFSDKTFGANAALPRLPLGMQLSIASWEGGVARPGGGYVRSSDLSLSIDSIELTLSFDKN